MRLHTILVAFAYLAGTGHIAAQQSATLPKQEQIHLLVRYYEEERQFNGNVLIAENGRITYENTVGWADVENNIPLTLETPFYLASVSKQFTAACILMLRDQRKLNLDDRISKYFVELGSHGDRITIRNLLNHTSGLPDYFAKGWAEPGLTNAQVYHQLITELKQLDFRPGYKYRYCNTGYMLLSVIVEQVSGVPYFQFVDDNICKPLGLQNTWVVDLRNKREAPRAIGYTSRMNRTNDYQLYTTGDGGLYSSIEDLFVWDKALYEGKIVSLESMEEAFRPLTLVNGKTENYGFGWSIGNNLNGKTVSHTGGLAGFRNYFERQLEVENTIIILSNNTFDAIREMRNILVKIIDGRPYSIPDQ